MCAVCIYARVYMYAFVCKKKEEGGREVYIRTFFFKFLPMLLFFVASSFFQYVPQHFVFFKTLNQHVFVSKQEQSYMLIICDIFSQNFHKAVYHLWILSKHKKYYFKLKDKITIKQIFEYFHSILTTYISSN